MSIAALAELDSGSMAFAPSGPDDSYYDYCLEPYKPRRPFKDKYRSENLFWHALKCAGSHTALEPALRAVQRSLGPDLTVWGVKWDGARLWSEIYVYDPQKEDPAATLSGLTATLEPFLEVKPRVDEAVPYVMVSIDLDDAVVARGCIDEVNLYLTGDLGHAGRSYQLRSDDMELTNSYRFLQAKPEYQQVLSLVKASPFMDFSGRNSLAQVIPPQLFACKKICVAKKRRADAIYFSGIAVDQLLWFLRNFSYPAPVIELVAQNESRFEHLYFDVGIDYRWDPAAGRVKFLKSSYYGTF